MSSPPARNAPEQAHFWRIALVLGLAAGVLLWAVLGRGPAGSAAGVVAEDVETDLVFHLEGPNDGEPLDGRSIRLDLTTNYERAGSLSVYAGGTFIESHTYLPGRGGMNLQTIGLELDLDEAGRILGQDLLDPDSGPLTITVYLYAKATGSLVGHASWSGYLDTPWAEFVVDETPENERGAAPFALVRAGGNAETREELEPDGVGMGSASGDAFLIPLGGSALLPHLRANDTFYLVATSPDRSILTLLPTSPRFLDESVFLHGGEVTGGDDPPPVLLAGWLRELAGRRSYLVVWAFDASRGWARSPVYRTR